MTPDIQSLIFELRSRRASEIKSSPYINNLFGRAAAALERLSEERAIGYQDGLVWSHAALRVTMQVVEREFERTRSEPGHPAQKNGSANGVHAPAPAPLTERHGLAEPCPKDLCKEPAP